MIGGAGLIAGLAVGGAGAFGQARVTDGGDGYVVVRVAIGGEGEEARAYREVADMAAAFHHAESIDFDGEDFDGLAKRLATAGAREVLFAITPARLDVNFQRRVIGVCNRLDGDEFADFAWGYFTARDGAALRKLWDRTAELHRSGLANHTWVEAAVTSGTSSFSYPDGASPLQQAAGFHGPHHYFAEVSSDPKVMEFVQSKLPELESASVISLSGNGDPQGIWLFSGNRNMDRSKHWPFDPAKVGQDPEGQMPRLTAAQLGALHLKNAIVWSGTCHSATPKRVYVEGDIVSTFGSVQKTTLYEMKPQESLCLAVLDAGAAAFIAPIGANHGYAAAVEEEYALEAGASLGEIVKATYDDVFLASDGRPRIALYKEGEVRSARDEAVMQANGVNRVLIGDPALRPFSATANPAETVSVVKKESGEVEVTVEWAKGFHLRAWDMYGGDRERDQRVWSRVRLDDGMLGGAGQTPLCQATVRGTDQDGAELPMVMKHAAVEAFGGERWLYVQANASRKAMEGKAIKAVFTVGAQTKEPRD